MLRSVKHSVAKGLRSSVSWRSPHVSDSHHPLLFFVMFVAITFVRPPFFCLKAIILSLVRCCVDTPWCWDLRSVKASASPLRDVLRTLESPITNCHLLVCISLSSSSVVLFSACEPSAARVRCFVKDLWRWGPRNVCDTAPPLRDILRPFETPYFYIALDWKYSFWNSSSRYNR